MLLRTTTVCLAFLSSFSPAASADVRTLTTPSHTTTEPLRPAAVLHHAIPYGYQPDPNPPASSKPIGDGIDENFARRVQQRHTQEILKQEIEEKFVSLYGQEVSLEAKCVSSDPGDKDWKDPLPIPFDENTTDPVALADHKLREIVQDAVEKRKKTYRTDHLSDDLVAGVAIVHEAPVAGVVLNEEEQESINNQTTIDLMAESIQPPGREELDGLEIGKKIALNVSGEVEEQQKEARIRDANNVLDVVEVEQ